MEIKGYKALNLDKTNRYGMPFEVGKTYKIDGSVSFGNKGNGFHFCTRLSDVFRYFEYLDGEVCVALVTGRGELKEFNDEYNGYYEMYVASEITIEGFLNRQDVMDIMLRDNDFGNKKFLTTIMLRDEEKLRFLRKYRGNYEMLLWLLYYQYDYKSIYGLSHKEALKQMRMVLDNGQNNS